MRDIYHPTSAPTSRCYNRKESEMVTSQQFGAQFGVCGTTVINWLKKL